jgi:regulator of protease activity HflC (stomatin/prohibitin superfamily)
MEWIIGVSIVLVMLWIVRSMGVTVAEGTVVVTTSWGRFARVLHPGYHSLTPFWESVLQRISIQNQSEELSFQAITLDQANVYFKTMLLYTVRDGDDETIRAVAFRFIDRASFKQALFRTIESAVRAFVASQKQAEILSLRSEITLAVKGNLDEVLAGWGYHLIDLQINEMTFDQVITSSMAQVVASNNLRQAAINEGEAMLVTRTKQAEAEGNAIRIAADAERTAMQLRGQGTSLFREEVAKGVAHRGRAGPQLRGLPDVDRNHEIYRPRRQRQPDADGCVARQPAATYPAANRHAGAAQSVNN